MKIICFNSWISCLGVKIPVLEVELPVLALDLPVQAVEVPVFTVEIPGLLLEVELPVFAPAEAVAELAVGVLVEAATARHAEVAPHVLGRLEVQILGIEHHSIDFNGISLLVCTID